MKRKTALLGAVALLVTVAAAEGSPGWKAWKRLPAEEREQATLALSGTYVERTDFGSLMGSDGIIEDVVATLIQIRYVHKGKFRTKEIRLPAVELPDRPNVVPELKTGRSYLVVLRVESKERLRELEQGGDFGAWRHTVDPAEIVSLVELPDRRG